MLQEMFESSLMEILPDEDSPDGKGDLGARLASAIPDLADSIAESMPITSVRRRISLLRRSCGLLDQIFFQWASGKLEKARTSGPASSSREAT